MDNRVKSVVAMSCWVDLEESFLGQGQTIRKEAVRFLQILAELTGHEDLTMRKMFRDYFQNKDLQLMIRTVKASSPITYVDRINENKASIFIANAYQDSLFTPNQFPKFFERLTTENKHIEFASGDHGKAVPFRSLMYNFLMNTQLCSWTRVAWPDGTA
jgi:hypothetical protein